MSYLLVLLAVVLLAFEFAFSKAYQLSQGVSLEAGLRFNGWNGLFTALIFLILCGFQVEFSLFSLLMAVGLSLCSTLYSILGFRVLKGGNMALYSVFLMSGGMVLPYMFGIVFLEEPLTAARLVGLLIILGAVLLSNGAKSLGGGKQLALCTAIFVLNGFVSILSKCHQVGAAFGPVGSTAFVLYSAVSRCVISFGLLLSKKANPVPAAPKGKVLGLISGAALIGGLSYLLQLVGARDLPASVLYPMITGGSIIFSTLSGMLFFKERPRRKQIIGILACFLGTLFFL